MKTHKIREQILEVPPTPVYELGRREPIGYLDNYPIKKFVEEWRCGYCNSLVVTDKTHCPRCGGEY